MFDRLLVIHKIRKSYNNLSSSGYYNVLHDDSDCRLPQSITKGVLDRLVNYKGEMLNRPAT